MHLGVFAEFSQGRVLLGVYNAAHGADNTACCKIAFAVVPMSISDLHRLRPLLDEGQPFGFQDDVIKIMIDNKMLRFLLNGYMFPQIFTNNS